MGNDLLKESFKTDNNSVNLNAEAYAELEAFGLELNEKIRNLENKYKCGIYGFPLPVDENGTCRMATGLDVYRNDIIEPGVQTRVYP